MKKDCINFLFCFSFFFGLHEQTGITLVELNCEPELLYQHDVFLSILATIILVYILQAKPNCQIYGCVRFSYEVIRATVSYSLLTHCMHDQSFNFVKMDCINFTFLTMSGLKPSLLFVLQILHQMCFLKITLMVFWANSINFEKLPFI